MLVPEQNTQIQAEKHEDQVLHTSSENQVALHEHGLMLGIWTRCRMVSLDLGLCGRLRS